MAFQQHLSVFNSLENDSLSSLFTRTAGWPYGWRFTGLHARRMTEKRDLT